MALVGKIKERTLLTKEGSTRRTFHIVIGFDDQVLEFTPGDSIAIMPENCPNEVDLILKTAKLTGEELITSRKLDKPTPLKTLLLSHANIHTTKSHKDLPLLETLSTQENALMAQEIADNLRPMLPRFYSIANSLNHAPNEIHLTVATFSRPIGERHIPGLGSHFLTERAQINHTPIYGTIHTNHTFSLPEDPATPIIMIGPGTGLAPFRGFLQERGNAACENWLFFGERHRNTDFYYEDELDRHVQEKRLKLNVAFSRDQEEKHYVHHEITKHKDELIDWIERGAHIYICGSAQKMAKDVRRTLEEIFESTPYSFRELKKAGRLLLDVY